MKLRTTLFLGIFLLAFCAFAQTELFPFETFDTWTVPASPPTGWTRIQGGSESPETDNANDWFPESSPSGIWSTSPVARIYWNPSETWDDWLITPTFDATGAVYDSIILVYETEYSRFSVSTGDNEVVLSTDGGTTWPNVLRGYGVSLGSVHETPRIDITALVAGSSNCRVAFHAQRYSYDDNWWEVDNVVVIGYEASPEPAAPGFAFTCVPSLPAGTTSNTFGVTITDGTGVDPASAEFCYSLNGATVVCEPLTYLTGAPDGTGDYEYELTGLEGWDEIEYYFIATDTYTPATPGTSGTCVTVIEGDYYIYEDGTGYPMSPDPTWVDHTTGFNWTAFAADDLLGTIYGYAFPLTFWGVSSDTIKASTNGWISFDGLYSGSSMFSEAPIPTAALPNALVAWMWEDQDGGNGGSEFWITNHPTDDWVMFSYVNWQQFPSSSPFSVQIQIWNPAVVVTPGDNCAIDVRWNTLPTDLTDGVMGIENWDGTRGLTYWEDGVVGDPDYLGLTSPTRTIRYCTVPPPSGIVYGNVDLIGRADNSGAEVGIVGMPLYTDLSDAAGDYRIDGVPPGIYDVYCTHPVFYPETVYSIILVEDDSVEVNFALDPMPIGYIQGYADLTDTPPLGEAGIDIMVLPLGLTTTTDATGYFFFDGVVAGDVQVVATYPGYTTDYTAVLSLAIGDTITTDTLFLDPGDWFYEDFEDDDGGGVVTGGLWEWGMPTSVGPDDAYSGDNCWGTDLDDEYGAYELAELEIPIPFAPVDTIRYWQYKDMESSFDGGNLEVSTDGGGTWTFVGSPVPPYDGVISTTFGNPLGGESGYWGSMDWHEVVIDLTATPGVNRIKFRFGSDDSFHYPGWYIDDILVGNMPEYTGSVDGYVYNCNTYETIAGATVHFGGGTAISDADGYFLLENIPYGTVDLAATLSGYYPGYLNDVNVFIDAVTTVVICMEPMGIEPIEGHLAYGEDDSVLFEFCNPTDDTIWFNWALLPYDLEDYLVRDGGLSDVDYRPSDENAVSFRSSAIDKELPSATRALGDIWRTYDVSDYHLTAWGLAISPTEFWVGNAAVYFYNHRYTRPDGNHIGFYDVTGIGGSSWMADMCYDSNRDYFWQVGVGGSNLLHAFDASTGAFVGSLPDPAMAWSWTSARGVGYDAERDVFYIGGWNYWLLYGYDVVFEVAGPSWPNPGVTMSYVTADYCAGVAWHPYRNTIFYVDALLGVINEVDPVADAVINTIPAPATAGELSGLAIDEFGQIWAVDQTNNMVYVLEGPTVGMHVEPDTFILPGECFTFALINEAWTTPVGDYCFDIRYHISDGQYDIFGEIPTCVQVQPRAYKGWELITVPLMATPNDPAIQFADDIVPFVIDPSSSNLYGYNQDAGILQLPAGFVRGKGYYLKTWLDRTYWDVYGDEYPAGDFTYTMYYPESSPNWGWWLVGNPYNKRIDWDQVYAYNDFTYMDAEYWIWSQRDGWTWYSPLIGGGGEDQFIDPWRGYFVYVRSGNPATWVNLTYPQSGTMETFLAKTSGAAKGAKVKTANPAEFDLRMSVRAVDGSDIRVDKYNFIGVSEAAADGIDEFDVRKPQVSMPGNYIDAHFVEGGVRMARSAKQNFNTDSKSWTFKVQGIPAGMNVTVSWPRDRVPTGDDFSIGVDNMDDRWTLTMIDNATGDVIDMRSAYSYAFTSTTSPRTFTVILGDDALDIPNAEMPTVYSLGANVPNPFNATTAIEVGLPKGGDVRVEVFDMLGKKVTTLVDGEMNAGMHRIVWNGVDNTGREVASGVYLYRVTAGDFSETKKMTLIK